ncbi:MAG: hypothetical protein KC416_03925, partial [Myxococcales bacterium]|nr:hypothetical protein [Myxococcales bacterium]
MFRRSPKPTDPLVRLELALQKGDHEDALLAYGELEKKGKGEPRWPHKRGDLLRRLGRDEEAIEAYRTAVDFYAARGFLARSIAMAKLILAIDPKRLDILERVDPDEA